MTEHFAGSGVDDPDVEVGDEEDDGGSGVGSSDADVVESAVVAEGHRAAVVDAVVADPVVGVGVVAGRGGCGAGLVGGGRGGLAGERAVGSVVVVVLDETVEQCLELGEGGGLVGLARRQRLRVWWRRSTLPQVVGASGAEFFWLMPRRWNSELKAVAAPGRRRAGW